MDDIKLNNGTTIPALGIGTFQMQPDDAEAAVTSALHDGYRLVDTANAYLNEKATGRAIKASGVDRSQLYVSTKLWPSIYGDAAKAIDDTLARLQLDYIDLLFLHQPVGQVDDAYRAIEGAVSAGKVRSIGLSNFKVEQIRDLAERMDVRPSVIQAEAHPYYPQHDLKAYLSTIGAVLMAWYPLGHGDKTLLEQPVFARLAQAYGKTPAQIVLRWHVQSGNVVIPGSRNPEHIRANADVFDFELTDQDMADIAKVDRNKPYYVATDAALQGYLNFAPDFGAQK
ncbi:MAG: aldo/keto reductase [Coriobacteriales bacterium]|jgi:diketogulonate reductase-like aldo/keto reductase